MPQPLPNRCRLGIVAALAECCVLAAAVPAHAVSYTWSSATTGGSWSVTTNWNPNGAPTSADTALLDDATANRTIAYEAAASGTLTGLSFTQTTGGVLNELQVQRALRVTNAVTLNASSGTARLLVLGTAASITGTFTGGVNVNSGGVLSLGLYNPSGTSTVYVPNLSGNVAVSGGVFELAAGTLLGTGIASGNHTVTGSLTMTSGTLFIDNAANRDRRLSVTGNLSVTGGSILSNSGNVANNLILNGAVNTFAPQAFDAAKIQISLQASGNQTFSGSTALGTLTPRGTGIKTLSNTGTISSLQFIDGSTTLGSRTTLKLASNVAAASAPFGAGFSQQADSAGNVEFGIDADQYTLDFSAAGVWTPTKFVATGMSGQAGTISNTVWALTGTAGTIRASGYNFATSGTTTLTTTVGPGLVLVATGATATNVLSGSGTIDPTSTFRFAAGPGSPATLSSDRAIGNLEVTSGTLRLGATFTSMQHVRVSGGSLDLLSKSLTVPSVRLTGGTLTTGTLTSAGSFDVQAGSLAAVLLGSGSLTKSGSGTAVLSGANGYSGTTTLSSGLLSLGVAEIEGTSGPLGTNTAVGAIVLSGGTLQYTASNQFDYSSRFSTAAGQQYAADTNGQAVTWATALGSSGGSLTKSGAGLLTLTNANTYDGGTTIAGGTLQLGNGSTTGSVAGDITNNAMLAFNRSDSFTFAAVISGSGGVTKAGAGTLTLTNANTYTAPTIVSAGTLALGDGGTTGSLAGPIALSNTTALVVNRSNDLTLGEVISGSGSLTKQGPGTLTLTAANTFVGTTTISAGTLALSGGNNRLATGGAVNFAGNAGLSVSGSQSLSSLALANNVSAVIAGGGALAVTGGQFSVVATGSNTVQTLDASGLASFSYSNAGGTFKVGGNNQNGTAIGRLTLPGTAAIIAAGVGVGTDLNNAFVSSGTLTLGTTTTISANAITLGANQSQGSINVAAGTVNPVLTLRAANGTSPVTNITIGTSGGYGLTTTSRIDLTGGTGASTLDAVVTNLVIGQSTRTTTFSGGINITGGLLMQSGTLAATTLTLGQTLNNPTFSASGQVISGSLSVSGGTVNVGTLYLADQNWTGGTVSGIFRLDGGGTLNAATIASGTGAGSGAAVRTFQWNDGTIANRDAATDLTIGSGISFALANTGTHRFSIGSGRSGSVASAISGAGGTLEKAGAGTLTLSANNSYTGATSVSAGTLLVNGDQSAAVGALTVDLGATLGGAGTIGGATTVNGTLSPGNSPGVLTLAELALGSTSTTLMEITGTARGGDYDGLTITQPGGLDYGGTLSLSLNTTFADNTTFDLFAFSGLMSGSFSSVTATGSYGSLTFTNDGLGVWSSGPTNVAGQSMTFSQSTGDLVIVPEPGALALAGLGIAATAWILRRSKQR